VSVVVVVVVVEVVVVCWSTKTVWFVALK
jgi:hypothetical protein